MYFPFFIPALPLTQLTSYSSQILRYGALGGGVFYGWTHQSTLTAKSKLIQAERERVHHNHLVEKAHEEYLKRKEPKVANGGESIIFLVNRPGFDIGSLESFLWNEGSALQYHKTMASRKLWIFG